MKFFSRNTGMGVTFASPGGPKSGAPGALGAVGAGAVGATAGATGAALSAASTVSDSPARKVTSRSSVIDPSLTNFKRYVPARMFAKRSEPSAVLTPSRATGPLAVTATSTSGAPTESVT